MPATNSGVHFAAYSVKEGVGLLLRQAPWPSSKLAETEQYRVPWRTGGRDDLPHEAEARYGLHRRFVLGGDYFGPYESEYFAREKHKVGGLADSEFFAVRDQP